MLQIPSEWKSPKITLNMLYIKCRRYKARVALQSESKSLTKRSKSIINCGHPPSVVFVSNKMFVKRMAFSEAIHSLYDCHLILNATIVVEDTSR